MRIIICICNPQKHKKRSVADSEPHSDSTPPKLVPRPNSRPTSQQQQQQQTTSYLPTGDQDFLSPSDTEVSQQEVIKPVSSKSRLIRQANFETIPEEDETVLDNSLVADENPDREEDGEENNAARNTEEKEEEKQEQGKEDEREGDGTEVDGKNDKDGQIESYRAGEEGEVARDGGSENLHEETVTDNGDSDIRI